MSTKSRNRLSTSMPSASSDSIETQMTRLLPGESGVGSEMVEQSGSHSPEKRLYDSPEFQLAWDNQIAFHVAEQAIHLRKLRGLSQARVAKAMRTSQSAVARIEGGDGNITLNTLQRLADALHGRLSFALRPAEASRLHFPAWWTRSTMATTVATFATMPIGPDTVAWWAMGMTTASSPPIDEADASAAHPHLVA
jgi:hypothetical protein